NLRSDLLHLQMPLLTCALTGTCADGLSRSRSDNGDDLQRRKAAGNRRWNPDSIKRPQGGQARSQLSPPPPPTPHKKLYHPRHTPTQQTPHTLPPLTPTSASNRSRTPPTPHPAPTPNLSQNKTPLRSSPVPVVAKQLHCRVQPSDLVHTPRRFARPDLWQRLG